jgi:glycine/D-amino acid oxidase-like deaminating enzyme
VPAGDRFVGVTRDELETPHGDGDPSRLPYAVLGGGILGVSTAFHLARSGASVVLMTDGPLGSGASGRSLSWLNSAGTRSAEYHRLRMAGLDRYRTLAAQHPGADWLRFDGGLRWSEADRADDLREEHDAELAHGYDSRLVGARDMAGLEPAVDAGSLGAAVAVWNAGEGWVDLPALIALLAEEFRRLGGVILDGVGRCRLELDDSRVAAVTTGAGRRFAVRAALLATGAAVPSMVADLGVSLPDATPLAVLVRTRPVSTGLRAVLNTPRVAIRPAPGGSLAVDADWTAAAIAVGEDGELTVPPAVVADLLAEASAVLSGNPELAAHEVRIGPKPIPGDGEPVLGAIPEVPGLHVAFTHSGATLGLIAGELLARHMTTEQVPPLIASFAPTRFD